MTENKKKRGYSTMEAQVEANRRYLENNEEAKKRNRYSHDKSACKRFINKCENMDELKEMQEILENRIKIIEK